MISPVHAEPPILKFPEGISWKGVFDSGLRPKHISGLERKLAECKDQKLQIVIENNLNSFFLDSGRLSIELMHDDQISLLKHNSSVPITLEEGKRRQDEFREMVREHLTQHGSIPPVMEERIGSVMTLSEQSVVARIGNHRLSYGFSSSYQKEKPILPRFMLSWHPSKGDSSPPIRRKTVEPPEGYEWYSLDPKVHTPDPGTETEPEPVAEVSESPNDLPEEIRIVDEAEPEETDASTQRTHWAWWAGLAAFLVAAAAGVSRWMHTKK